ncbi:MAG: hypothetical protein K9H64_20440 [Bacteroidales bacterium]|nr:hypothetical protein [Bacteroidales bacterium]MCF8458424.1 hypothetical protein [Bacteroidales bacterium]
MEGITKSKLLGVEGIDEVNFFKALFDYQGIQEVQILNFEGKTNFSSRIRSIINIPGFKNVSTFGLVRDADTLPPKSAYDSLKGALEKANLPVPSEVNSFSNTELSVGVFIMPGKSSQGMLEDLCLSSIKNQPVSNCISEFLDCAEAKTTNESKAKVLCYLATKSPVVNSLGLSALKGCWEFDSSEFDEIKAFLKAFA